LAHKQGTRALTHELCEGVGALGGVPAEPCRGVRGPRGPARRTDSLSAAYRNLGPDEAEDVTRRYEAFSGPCGLIASRNNPGPLVEVRAHENGAVESHHGHLKTALDQALILRGGRDFAAIDDYRRFVDQLVGRRNRRREDRTVPEMAALRPLPAQRTTDFTIVRAVGTPHPTASLLPGSLEPAGSSFTKSSTARLPG